MNADEVKPSKKHLWRDRGMKELALLKRNDAQEKCKSRKKLEQAKRREARKQERVAAAAASLADAMIEPGAQQFIKCGMPRKHISEEAIARPMQIDPAAMVGMMRFRKDPERARALVTSVARELQRVYKEMKLARLERMKDNKSTYIYQQP